MGNTMRPIDSMKELQRLKYYFECRSPRDRMLLEIMLQTGYRIGDLVDLLVGDVKETLEKREFCIREKKIVNMKKAYCLRNNLVFNERDVSPRIVPISLDFAKELKKHIKNKKDDEYMFPSRFKGHHISEDRFGKLLSKAGKDCGIKYPICNHTLRKTFALNVHRITKDIKKTQRMLSHSTEEATELYIGTDMIMFRDTIEELAKLYK